MTGTGWVPETLRLADLNASTEPPGGETSESVGEGQNDGVTLICQPSSPKRLTRSIMLDDESSELLVALLLPHPPPKDYCRDYRLETDQGERIIGRVIARAAISVSIRFRICLHLKYGWPLQTDRPWRSWPAISTCFGFGS